MRPCLRARLNGSRLSEKSVASSNWQRHIVDVEVAGDPHQVRREDGIVAVPARFHNEGYARRAGLR